MSFWDVVWFIVISFAFIAYLMVMFSIIADLFRDRDTSGVVKAVWIIGLIIFPFLVALIYLIVKGNGMAERSARSADTMRRQQDEYIKSVAGQQRQPRGADREGPLDARRRHDLPGRVRAAQGQGSGVTPDHGHRKATQPPAGTG